MQIFILTSFSLNFFLKLFNDVLISILKKYYILKYTKIKKY